jgi:hypothetical protein
MLAAAFTGEWGVLAELIILVVLTYGSRALGLYLERNVEEASYEEEIMGQ